MIKVYIGDCLAFKAEGDNSDWISKVKLLYVDPPHGLGTRRALHTTLVVLVNKNKKNTLEIPPNVVLQHRRMGVLFFVC